MIDNIVERFVVKGRQQLLSNSGSTNRIDANKGRKSNFVSAIDDLQITDDDEPSVRTSPASSACTSVLMPLYVYTKLIGSHVSVSIIKFFQ
jgi:hypothetical protein